MIVDNFNLNRFYWFKILHNFHFSKIKTKMGKSVFFFNGRSGAIFSKLK